MAKPCIEQCGQLAKPGHARCPTHLKQHGQAKNRRRASRAHPTKGAAAKLRRAINRAGYGACNNCRRWFNSGGIEIDHITPLEDGGQDTGANIQPLCHQCHATKTQDENRARLTARR